MTRRNPSPAARSAREAEATTPPPSPSPSRMHVRPPTRLGAPAGAPRGVSARGRGGAHDLRMCVGMRVRGHACAGIRRPHAPTHA